MKKVVTACSVLCALIALLSLVMGVKGLFGGSDFIISLAIFRFISQGTIMSFLGNVLSVVVMVYGFGMMALYGFDGTHSSKKKGFAYGAVMTCICLLSMVFAIFGHFTIGDLLLVALPAVYTFGMLKTA